MSQMQRITFNSEQCGGRPYIRGMRIRVRDVLEMLASGATAPVIVWLRAGNTTNRALRVWIEPRLPGIAGLLT